MDGFDDIIDTNNIIGELARLPTEIRKFILRISDICTIGRVAQLSTYCRQMANPTARVTSLDLARRRRIAALRRYNVLEDLLKYSGGADLETIISHPNITFDIIKRYPNIEWNWGYITTNPNITLEMLLELIDVFKIPSDTVFVIDERSAVTMRELIESGRGLHVKLYDSIATVEDYLNGRCLCGEPVYFQMTGAITENDVLNCKEITWNYEWFAHNKHLSVEFLYNYCVQNAHLMRQSARFTHRAVRRLCEDPVYGPKYIQLFMDAINNGSLIIDEDLMLLCSLLFPLATLIQKPQLCSWEWICSRDDIILSDAIPFDVIMEHFDETRMWFIHNEIIKMPDDVTIDHPWMQYIKMSFENKLTIDVILANPHIPWNWVKLANCGTIAIDDLLNVAETSSYFMVYMSSRYDLTIDVINKHADLPWSWGAVYKTLECTFSDMNVQLDKKIRLCQHIFYVGGLLMVTPFVVSNMYFFLASRVDQCTSTLLQSVSPDKATPIHTL